MMTMSDAKVRLVVLTDREHFLVCHLLRSGLKLGWLANGATVALLERLERAREAPVMRRTQGWLNRWRS